MRKMKPKKIEADLVVYILLDFVNKKYLIRKKKINLSYEISSKNKYKCECNYKTASEGQGRKTDI